MIKYKLERKFQWCDCQLSTTPILKPSPNHQGRGVMEEGTRS